MPWTRSQPARSRNASSIDSGSTSGVSSDHHRADLFGDAGVFGHVGRQTIASGQSFSAAAVGIAERTPLVRAM